MEHRTETGIRISIVFISNKPNSHWSTAVILFLLPEQAELQKVCFPFYSYITGSSPWILSAWNLPTQLFCIPRLELSFPFASKTKNLESGAAVALPGQRTNCNKDPVVTVNYSGIHRNHHASRQTRKVGLELSTPPWKKNAFTHTPQHKGQNSLNTATYQYRLNLGFLSKMGLPKQTAPLPWNPPNFSISLTDS